MICDTCGDKMVGDGFTRVLHCPSVDCDDVEPDANPIHCKPVEKSLQRKIDQLTEAFDRQSLQLEQTQKMLDQYKRQLSELESVIIKARNALTPRGMSCERIEVMSLSGEKKIVVGERDVPDQD